MHSVDWHSLVIDMLLVCLIMPGYVLFFIWLGSALRHSVPCLDLLGDINRFGFDMAFPAIMLVLLKGMWKGFTEARPWLISFICAALAYSYLPGNWYVLIGALAGIAAAFWLIQKDEA
jgi:Predicted branched-chain amino acid permease (azaleucine resistance)